MTRNEQLQKEVNELREVVDMIGTPTFQTFIAKRFRDEQESLKLSFFSKDLREQWRKGGKYEGLEYLFDVIRELQEELKSKQFDLETTDQA